MERDKPAARGAPRMPDARVREVERELERDAEGKELGPHPVGTAMGGVAGAVAAGAAAGSIAGPIGAAVGGAIGAVAGGVAGSLASGAVVDPEKEDEYWRGNWQQREYARGEFSYDQDWSPAYRYGVEAYNRHPKRDFDELEGDLCDGWNGYCGGSRLDWERARPASREAWDRARALAAGNLPREGGDRP